MTPGHRQRDERSLVLVAGAGRSGTSTVTGALNMLGFHVPAPHLKTNESNPRGFFESRWPVRFHNRILDTAGVGITDGRPEAFEDVRAAVTDQHGSQLDAWLEQLAEHDRIAVKDPRAIWMPWLWEQAAAAQGLEVGYLTMIRHPAEVLGSRQTYYKGNQPTMSEWAFDVRNLCGWINANLIVERETRGSRRAVVGYPDLVGDWRSALRPARDALGLDFDDPLLPGSPHEIDSFIDAKLRRHDPAWSRPDLPGELRRIAEAVHGAMVSLAGSTGRDAGAEAALDEASDRYRRLHDVSSAIAMDQSRSPVPPPPDPNPTPPREQEPAPTSEEPRPERSLRSRIGDRYPALRRIRRRVRGRRS